MSYEVVRLGDVCETSSGGTPLRNRNEYFEDGTIPWIKSGELSQGKISYAEEMITELGLKNSSAKLFPKDTILVAMYGATIGQVGILEFEATTNQAICGIFPNDIFLKEYLYLYLKFQKNYLISLGSGGAQPNISQAIIRDLQIPLPPLDIQKKIADTLDKAQELIDKRKEQISALDKFLENLFLDMFGDPMSNPMGWERGTIRDIVSDVKYGSSSKANDFEGNYAMLRMNNITYSGGWDFSSLKYIELKENEIEKYTVNKNDILFNRTNSKELVGKTAVYRQDTPMAYAGYLIRVRSNEKANSEYISAYLNSKYGKSTLFNMCKSIVGQANINAQELQDININIPPLDLQNQFASLVEKVEAEKIKLEASLTEMEDTFNSIMQRAFKGELF